MGNRMDGTNRACERGVPKSGGSAGGSRAGRASLTHLEVLPPLLHARDHLGVLSLLRLLLLEPSHDLLALCLNPKALEQLHLGAAKLGDGRLHDSYQILGGFR